MKKPFQLIAEMASSENWGDSAAPKRISLNRPQVAKSISFFVTEPFKDAAFLHQKYVLERLSTKEISDLISSSRSTVSKYLRRFGIPIRPQDQEHRSRSQLRYGEAWRNRQVAVHKKELETLARIRKLRNEGLSYWKIADVLNAWGIPTKTRRGRWHARSVQKILDDNGEKCPARSERKGR